jgi:hypothetical protein
LKLRAHPSHPQAWPGFLSALIGIRRTLITAPFAGLKLSSEARRTPAKIGACAAFEMTRVFRDRQEGGKYRP